MRHPKEIIRSFLAPLAISLAGSTRVAGRQQQHQQLLDLFQWEAVQLTGSNFREKPRREVSEVNLEIFGRHRRGRRRGQGDSEVVELVGSKIPVQPETVSYHRYPINSPTTFSCDGGTERLLDTNANIYTGTEGGDWRQNTRYPGTQCNLGPNLTMPRHPWVRLLSAQ